MLNNRRVFDTVKALTVSFDYYLFNEFYIIVHLVFLNLL